jgi:CBS domain-containing protein
MNALLHVKTLAELLQAKHDAVGERVSQVVTLEHTQTVGDALITLQRHGVLAAPLLVFPTLRGILGEGTACPSVWPCIALP